MTKDEVIDQLWERSNHGTRREDVVAAYEAGAATEREACAKVCDDLIDTKEEARAALRAAKAIDSGDEDDMLAALKHESNVSLYGAGISKCAAAIRAREST